MKHATFEQWKRLGRDIFQVQSPMPRNTVEERMSAVMVDVLIRRIKMRVRAAK